MIRSLIAATFLLALLASCGKEVADPVEPPPVADTSLEITTWNLQWFPGKKPGNVPPAEQEAHIASVARVLEDLDPDILCVQEIKDPASLQQLAGAMPGHSVQVVSTFRGTQEVAILSRHSAEVSFAQEFAKAPATPPRRFAHAAFRFGDQILGDAIFFDFIGAISSGLTHAR
ncbi:MAG: endonuclease/exonuclease/phosphatase family protein [Verrucomicrobiales bacterium]